MAGNQFKLLTLTEIANHLGLPKSHLYLCTKKGILPHYRVGHKFYYNLEEVKKVLGIKTEANVVD